MHGILSVSCLLSLVKIAMVCIDVALIRIDAGPVHASECEQTWIRA